MNTYLYIAVMALTTYAIRVLPLTLIRKPIKSTFVGSFLYYVAYVTLAVMTFPARLVVTDSLDRRRRIACRHCKCMAGDGTSAGFAPLLRNRSRTAISHLICCIDTRRPPEKMPAAFVFYSYSDSLRFLPLTAFPRYGGLGRIRLYRVGTCRSVSTKCGNSSNEFD